MVFTAICKFSSSRAGVKVDLFEEGFGSATAITRNGPHAAPVLAEIPWSAPISIPLSQKLQRVDELVEQTSRLQGVAVTKVHREIDF